MEKIRFGRDIIPKTDKGRPVLMLFQLQNGTDHAYIIHNIKEYEKALKQLTRKAEAEYGKGCSASVLKYSVEVALLNEQIEGADGKIYKLRLVSVKKK